MQVLQVVYKIICAEYSFLLNTIFFFAITSLVFYRVIMLYKKKLLCDFPYFSESVSLSY